MNIRYFAAALMTALLLALFAGCGGGDEPLPETTQAQTTTEATTTAPTTKPPTTAAPTTVPPEPELRPADISPLTGLDVGAQTAAKRPAAFMVNNSKRALPHRGLGSADLYFEIRIEGEFNRIMAVFQDYDNVPELGSIRSARDYFIDYAMGMDCIYIHLGGSPQAYTAMKTRGIDWLDGITGRVESLMFHRDSARRKNNGYEHSAFAIPEQLCDAIENFGYRDTLADDFEPLFSFSDKPAAGTIDAPTVRANYSWYVEPIFTYDKATGLYLREEFGGPHIDELTGEQLAVTNIFFVFTGHKNIAGDEAHRITVTTLGSGEGYYITGGKATEVTWQKDSHTDRLRFLKNGKEISVAPGKSWICVLPASAKEDVFTLPED